MGKADNRIKTPVTNGVAKVPIVMQLEALEEGEEKGNFFLNIEKRLERTELAAMRFKNDHRARRILYIVMAIVLAAVMGVSMGV